MDPMLQLALAGIVAFAIEKIKQSPNLSWITPYTDSLTKLLAAVVAVASAIGIAYTFDAEHGALTITGLPTTLDEGASIVITAIEQYWGQKLIFLTAIKPYERKDLLVQFDESHPKLRA